VDQSRPPLASLFERMAGGAFDVRCERHGHARELSSHDVERALAEPQEPTADRTARPLTAPAASDGARQIDHGGYGKPKRAFWRGRRRIVEGGALCSLMREGSHSVVPAATRIAVITR
jgi:hypothetical protein